MSIYASAVAAERAAKIARDMVAHETEVARLRAIEAAARNLVAQKGRYHTEVAYKRLVEVLTPNAGLEVMRTDWYSGKQHPSRERNHD